jgi:hypothetical protein
MYENVHLEGQRGADVVKLRYILWIYVVRIGDEWN